MSDERRRFSRVPFDAHTLVLQDAWSTPVQLIDISLRGVLVLQPETWKAERSESPFNVLIELSNGTKIHMETRLAHAEEGLLGFECTHIDLDSISHLRRLIALNTGDEALLERELKALL
ncbi:MAG TPA: PilZ domain-containing protein [Pseudomonas sabulinigri]|uniref:PilZ domain-containing protein n=1 Tax=marine sediment metagenome TaxID=412755 RepID=A0A0F9XKX0_9ZZZZ|nr:PilZ domain-containing protein [Halopseudomonas sabulinigri]HEC52367.1 PilZ domain-containing protein [Halopseudomonas sabulinigri]